MFSDFNFFYFFFFLFTISGSGGGSGGGTGSGTAVPPPLPGGTSRRGSTTGNMLSLKSDPKRRGRVVKYNGAELWKLWRPKMVAMSIFIALDRIKKANDKLKAEAAKNPKPKAAAGARGAPRGGPRGKKQKISNHNTFDHTGRPVPTIGKD